MKRGLIFLLIIVLIMSLFLFGGCKESNLDAIIIYYIDGTLGLYSTEELYLSQYGRFIVVYAIQRTTSGYVIKCEFDPFNDAQYRKHLYINWDACIFVVELFR